MCFEIGKTLKIFKTFYNDNRRRIPSPGSGLCTVYTYWGRITQLFYGMFLPFQRMLSAVFQIYLLDIRYILFFGYIFMFV